MDPLTAALVLLLVIAIGGLGALALHARRTGIERAREARRSAELEERADALAAKLRAAEAALSTAETAATEKEQLAAIGELSAMIAHEIRNPLTIIGNAVAMLRRPEIAAEDRATLLGILEEESQRLNGLVGDLLSYARPVSLELQAVSVREIVVRALALVPERPGLYVELIEPEPVGPVLADAKLLRQVFENLVTNAAQAMAGEDGTLTVTIRRGQSDGIAGVDVIVEDTGEGMDTEVRDRALLPFFTTRPSGTGLGLAIVARFVRAHGGKLELKSASGKGTSVRVFLPRDDRPAAGGEVAAAGPTRATG